MYKQRKWIITYAFTRCTTKQSVRPSDSYTSSGFSDWPDDVASLFSFEFSLARFLFYSENFWRASLRSDDKPSWGVRIIIKVSKFHNENFRKARIVVVLQYTCLLNVYSRPAQPGSKRGPMCKNNKQFCSPVSFIVIRVRFGEPE